MASSTTEGAAETADTLTWAKKPPHRWGKDADSIFIIEREKTDRLMTHSYLDG